MYKAKLQLIYLYCKAIFYYISITFSKLVKNLLIIANIYYLFIYFYYFTL